MAGKGYNPADPELKERARAMRKEGQTIESIATDLSVSSGAVSGWCRDITIKHARGQKEGASVQRESKGIMEATAGAKMDPETVDLANRVRKARLQSELDEVEDRKHQRQEVEDLRIRERKLLIQLDESRLGAAKGDSGVVTEINQLRSDLTELREARHQAELRQMNYQHEVETKRLEQMIAGISRTGLTQFDLMSQAMGKVENLLITAGNKVDGVVANVRSDHQFDLALQLGLSPDEMAILKRGLETPMTRDQYDILLGARTPEEMGTYEWWLARTEAHNSRYRELVARAGPKLKRGNDHPGKIPDHGEAESVVLKADSKVVKCQRCGATFDVDLYEARQHAAQGKKLFVNCPNPKCTFLLDVTEMIPELQPAPALKCTPVADKSTIPECYVAGQDGRCNSELIAAEQCNDCRHFGDTIKPLVYE
ncbi:hypothetical protein ES705_11109 [subsurface metagenome]